jgi:hypothetical protein
MNITMNLYQKFCDGSSLSDSEVIDGEHYFGHLADQLQSLGPRFFFAGNELRRCAREFESFRIARNLKRVES